ILKKQLSTIEVEYRALRLLVAKVTWVVRLLGELEVPDPQPADVSCDSQVVFHIAKNSVFHEHTKHIEVDIHYIRNALTAGLISLHSISTVG
ncbi:hypothetical protein MTR67_019576, partial [Solanum verrucosum]